MLSWQSPKRRHAIRFISIIIVEICLISFLFPADLLAQKNTHHLVPPFRSTNRLSDSDLVGDVQANLYLKLAAGYVISLIQRYIRFTDMPAHEIKSVISTQFANKWDDEDLSLIPSLEWVDLDSSDFVFSIILGDSDERLSLATGIDEFDDTVFVKYVDIPVAQADGRPIQRAPTSLPGAQRVGVDITEIPLAKKGEFLRFAFEGAEPDGLITEEFDEQLSNFRPRLEFENGNEALIQVGLVSKASYAMNGLSAVLDDPRIGKPRLFIIGNQPRVATANIELMISTFADDIVNAYFFGGMTKVTVVARDEKQARFIRRQLSNNLAGLDESTIRRVTKPGVRNFIIRQARAFRRFLMFKNDPTLYDIDDLVEVVFLDSKGKCKDVPVYIKGKEQMYEESADIEVKEDGKVIIKTSKKDYRVDSNNLPRVESLGYREEIPPVKGSRIPFTSISLGDGTPAADRPTSGVYYSLVPGQYGLITDVGIGTYENFRRLRDEAGLISATEKLVIFISHGHLDHIGDLMDFLTKTDVAAVIASPVVEEQLKQFIDEHLEGEGVVSELSKLEYYGKLMSFEEESFDSPSKLYLSEIIEKEGLLYGYDIDRVGYDVELSALITRQPPYNYSCKIRAVDEDKKPIRGYPCIWYSGDMKYDKEGIDESQVRGFRLAGEFEEADEFEEQILSHRAALLEFLKDVDVMIVEWGGVEIIHNTTADLYELMQDVGNARGDEAHPEVLVFHYNEADPEPPTLPGDNRATLMKPGTIITPTAIQPQAVTVGALRFFNQIRAIFRDEEKIDRFVREAEQKGAAVRYFSKETDVTREGVQGVELFFLVNGTASVEQGGRVIANLTAGNMIGENVIRGENANATVRVSEGSIAIVLNKDFFERLDRDLNDELTAALERIAVTRGHLNRFIEQNGANRLVKNMSEELRTILSLMVEVRELERGEVMVEEDQLLDEGKFSNLLAIIAEGSVDIWTEDRGYLGRRETGQTVLEIATILGNAGSRRNATVTADTSEGATLFCLSKDDIEFLRKFYPALNWFVFDKAAEVATTRTQEEATELVAKRAKKRGKLKKRFKGYLDRVREVSTSSAVDTRKILLENFAPIIHSFNRNVENFILGDLILELESIEIFDITYERDFNVPLISQDVLKQFVHSGVREGFVEFETSLAILEFLNTLCSEIDRLDEKGQRSLFQDPESLEQFANEQGIALDEIAKKRKEEFRKTLRISLEQLRYLSGVAQRLEKDEKARLLADLEVIEISNLTLLEQLAKERGIEFDLRKMLLDEDDRLEDLLDLLGEYVNEQEEKLEAALDSIEFAWDDMRLAVRVALTGDVSGIPTARRAALPGDVTQEVFDEYSDVMIEFNDAEEEFDNLIAEGKEPAVFMIDGDSIKKRNEAFGNNIVDWMIKDMVDVFLEVARFFKIGPNGLNMRIFRRGGDKFAGIFEADGVDENAIKAIVELMRMGTLLRVRANYGVFNIDRESLGAREQEVLRLLEEIEGTMADDEDFIVREFDVLEDKIVVLYNKNRPEEVEALKEKIGVTLTEEVGDKFALTGSIGVVKADSNVRAAIANELRRIGKLGDGEARIRLAHIMGGANTALAIAKKEVEKRKAHQKAKGDRVHVLSSSGDLRIDEWFQGADGIASIFHEDIQQEEIQTAFDESEIPDNERDVQVPTVYSDAALREKVYSNPSGIIFALDALWGHERFDEFAAFTEETLKKPHKGCSELKGWYKFGMLNDALPKMMHDADWVIRLFGYVVNARVRELFNSDAYEVYIARAPPGQSPDRFLVWITSKDEARHKLSIDSLKNDLPILLEDVAEEIASYSIRASLQATVVPIQEKPPMTFGLIDRLSKLPVDYDEGLEDGEDKKMYQPVLKPFKEAMLNTGENVIITEDEHRIVVYDEENAHIEDMEAALSRFIALRRQYALKALDGAMPEETEYYHGTLREIYADIVGLDKNLPFFEAVIPDEMSFVVAEKLIIEQIKNRRAKRLAEIQERLEINWRSVFGHALLDEMRHMLSKISGIIYTLEEFIDIPDIELHRELIDAPIEISDEEKSKAETRRDLRGLPDSDIQAPQLIPTQEVIAMFERALLAIRAINEHLALLDLEDEKVRLIIGREGQDAEIKHIRGLFTLLNSLLDRGEFKLAADILEAQVEFLQEEQHTRAVSIEDAWNGFVKRMDYKTERPLAGEKEEIRRFWNSADRRLSFKVNSLNPYISVHPVLLQRIFGEMVSNAAMKNKGQEDLEILISVNDGFNDEGKPQLIITVEDNGKGIPREMREIDNGSGRQRLFTLEGTTTGGGVGLTEAYLIVSDANGTITADNKSSVGKEGARFTIRLPRSISGEMNQLAKQVAIRLREHYIQDSQLLIRELLRDGEIQYREGTLTLAEYVKEVAEKSKMEIEELLNSFQPDDWEELAVLIWENVTLEPYEIRARLENSLKIQGEILSEIAEVEDRDIQDNFPGTILGDDLPKKHELFKRMKAIDTSRRIREPAGKDAVMFDISAPGFETLLNRYIELPAQAIIRRILELGGTPYLSNAFGPGIIGVRWSKDGIRYFTPLTVDEYDFERLADETFGKRQSALLRSSKWEELDADLWDQVLEEDKQLIEKLISADSDEQERLMQKYPDRIYPPANDLEGEGRSFYVELLEPINDVNNGSIATISVLQLKGIKPEADNKGEVLVRNVGVGKNISVDRRSFSLNIERIDEPSGGATKSASDYEHKIYKELAQEGLVASPIGRGIYHQLSFGKEQEMLGHIALGLEDVDTRLSLVVDEDIESAYLGIFNKKTGETTFVGSREDEAKLMEQIGRRLRMEHDLGYAHRAIFSFDNIRIHVANGEWVVRLIDREATLRLGDQPEIEEVAYRLLDISKVLARLWLEDTGPLSNQLNEALLRGYFNTETPPTPSDFDGPRALWGRLYMFIGGRAIEENDWNEGPLSLLLNGLETITVNNRVNRQRAQLMNLVATEVPELGGLMNETDTVRKAETETKATGQTIAISFNTLTLSYEDDSKYYMFDIREAIELALGAGNKVLLFSETSTDEEIRKNLLDAGVPEILLSSLEIVAGEEAVGEIDRSNLSALISNRDDYPDIQDKLGASEQTEYGMLENHNIALLEIPSMLSGIVYLMVQNGTLKVENANGFISKLVGSVADGQIPNYYTATLDAADKIRENL